MQAFNVSSSTYLLAILHISPEVHTRAKVVTLLLTYDQTLISSQLNPPYDIGIINE